MKKLNKKGFTLVEIIITLAIVITITTVAVGSYIGISSQKKKEEWKLVKEQIETAAEQYFSSNKNLYEDFDITSKISAYISVGTLVDKDYLNKVVNPITKKEVPACSIVTVKIDDGKYIGTYDEKEDTEKCKLASNGISFTEAGAANIRVNILKLDGTHDPVNSNNTTWYDKGVNYKLEVNSKSKSIVDIKYCIGDNNCSTNTSTTNKIVKYEIQNNTDEKNKYACFMVTTNTGKKSKACSDVTNIDNSTPTCTAKFDNANSNGWTNKDAIVKAKTCSDSGVGCSSYSNITNTYKQETSGTDVSVTVKDKLDHSNSCKDTVRVDKTSPTFNVGLYKKNSNNPVSSSNGLSGYSNNTWINKWVYTQVENASDTLSGIESYSYTTTGTTQNDTDRSGNYRSINAEGVSTIKYKVCDKAGNCKDSSTYTIKLDRTAPTFNVGLYKKNSNNSVSSSNGLSGYSNNTWINKWVYTQVENASDTLSGIESYSYTTTGKTQNDTDRSGNYRSINAEGVSTIQYKVCDKVGNCKDSSTYTIKLDRTAPTIKYIVQPKAKSCGGKAGVYIKYEVSDNLSGVKETYHYYGKDTGAKEYSYISGFNMKVVDETSSENVGPISVERTWAVGNPKGCASENPAGPNTSWCYYNNTAVKDYAGNTKTAISSSCSKVGS